jgi:hypothetical protein
MNNNDYQELFKNKSLTSNNFNVNRTNSIDVLFTHSVNKNLS